MPEKITKIDSKLASKLASEIVEAAQRMASVYGLQIQRKGNLRYGADNMRFQIEVAVLDEEGNATSSEAMDFRRLAPMNGINSSALGAVWTRDDGDEWEIMGWAARRPKYPVIVRNRRTLERKVMTVRYIKGALFAASKGHSYK